MGGTFFFLWEVGGSFVGFKRKGSCQFIQCCFTYCIFICDYFLKLIRPHARAVEILCGRHLMMNVFNFLSCCSLKKEKIYTH